MAEQNFKNHARLVPGFHYAAFTLVLFALVISCIHLFKAIGAQSGRLSAAAEVALALAVVLALWFARVFSLKAQDRAIRSEGNFRHFIATGKPFDSRLRMGQIIALRFADDDEFVELAKKAADENLSPKQIKEAITKWKADHHRV